MDRLPCVAAAASISASLNVGARGWCDGSRRSCLHLQRETVLRDQLRALRTDDVHAEDLAVFSCEMTFTKPSVSADATALPARSDGNFPICTGCPFPSRRGSVRPVLAICGLQ